MRPEFTADHYYLAAIVLLRDALYCHRSRDRPSSLTSNVEVKARLGFASRNNFAKWSSRGGNDIDYNLYDCVLVFAFRHRYFWLLRKISKRNILGWCYFGASDRWSDNVSVGIISGINRRG